MDLIIRFENPDNINYKMLFYKGPRSRGIGKPILGNETIVKDVKCGDVFCYKTFADGYYTYKKSAFIKMGLQLNIRDLRQSKKKENNKYSFNN